MIKIRYKTVDKQEALSNWSGEIQDCGNLFLVVIYKANKDKYCDFWAKSLRAGKVLFAIEMGLKGIKWEQVIEPIII